ncbi:adenylate/guanylate cyclase domain-containing protein [Nocardioides korecus]
MTPTEDTRTPARASSGEETSGAGGLDPEELVDRLEAFLLGESPTLTGEDIAAAAGITHESAQKRWRSLGFSAVDADVVAFTHADQEALQLTQRLVDVGLISDEDESALARTLGRSFARLAEWQMGLLAHLVDLDEMSVEDLRELMDVITPTVEQLQNYVWRRHTLSAASRLLLAGGRGAGEPTAASEAGAPDGAGTPDGAGATAGAEGTESADDAVMGVGFADIVNYTRQSRSLTRSEIARMIDRFEDRALELVTAHHGRVIKSIGDEILFVADDPRDVARLGLALVAEHERDADFPELRVGLAWGPALARLGDVLGPVVNVASRLTSTSRPGRVLVDRALAEELESLEESAGRTGSTADGFRLRRLRRTSVRGYRRLEPWSLRGPTQAKVPDESAPDEDPAGDPGDS